MSRSRRAIAAATLISLAACSNHGLPVAAKQCDSVAGNPPTVSVRIFNGADKPVRSVSVTLDYYRDFKFNRVAGAAIFLPAIEPNHDAKASLALANPKDATGSAQRCAVTSITYADGTTQSADK